MTLQSVFCGPRTFDSSKNYIWLGWLFVAADFSLAVVSRGYSLIAEHGLQGHVDISG